MTNQYRNQIQVMRKTIIYQLFAIDGCLLEKLNEETQEMFTESILEVLKENRGTKSQYMRLLDINLMIGGVNAHFEHYYSGEQE